MESLTTNSFPRLTRLLLTALVILPSGSLVGAINSPAGSNPGRSLPAKCPQRPPEKEVKPAKTNPPADTPKTVPTTATDSPAVMPKTIPSPSPTPPVGTNTDSKVWLKWMAAWDASSYNIRRSLDRNGEYTLIGSTSATEFVDASVANGTLYYYVVTSKNSAKESQRSDVISARPTSSQPTNLTLTLVDGQLQITWPADHTGWVLQMSSLTLVTGVSTNWTSLTNTIATNSVTVPVILTSGGVFFRLAHP